MNHFDWEFGVARSHAVPALQSRLAALCTLMSESLGARFAPFPAPRYEKLMNGIVEGNLGVAWLPPVLAMTLEEAGFARTVCVPSRKNTTGYHAAFVVRAGGPKTLAELQGRRVAWVDPDSAAGYVVPRLHLASLGYDPTKFFGQELFAHSHLSVVDSVANGRADVGTTFCRIDPVTKEIQSAGWTEASGLKVRPVEIVALAGPIPNDAIVVSERMPKPLQSAVTRWFLSPPDEARPLLLELIGAEECRVPEPDHFAPLRHMVRAARARGYSASGGARAE